MSTRPARGLYDRMTTFESLWTAARLARRGKRRSPSTAKFEHRLESVLLQLQQALRAEQYTFGTYRTFAVPLPSPRVIRAAPYRDRVVHHAIHAKLEPLLERRMIEHSFACRVGKGTHRALDTLQQFLRGGAWVLKLDISKYFYSIDHAILQQQLARHIADEKMMALVAQVLETYDAAAEYYFPQQGDDLFDAVRPRGLPIGHLSSQLFANWYLTPVDQFVKRTLGWRRYVRYMDNVVFVGASRDEMATLREQVEAAVRAPRLTPHPTKTQLFPVRNGVPFLGFPVYPHHRRILRGNLRHFSTRMRRYAREVETGTLALHHARASLRSWLGYADRARNGRLIERILDTI